MENKYIAIMKEKNTGRIYFKRIFSNSFPSFNQKYKKEILIIVNRTTFEKALGNLL